MNFSPQKFTYNKDFFNHQLDLWRYFFNDQSLELKKKFKNPYRDDKNPGCRLDWKGNYIILYDNPYQHHGKSVFYAIKDEYNFANISEVLSFLHKKNLPFGRKDFKKPQQKIHKQELLQCNFDNWNDLDYEFWCANTPLDFKIIQELDGLPIRKFFVNRNEMQLPCRTYLNKIKPHLYKAYGPELRFFYTNYRETLGGTNHNRFSNDTLIISKNFKSHCILKSCDLTDSIYLSCEGRGISNKIPLTTLKDWCLKYKKVLGFFDGDEAGQVTASEFNLLNQKTNVNIFKGVVLPNLDTSYTDVFGNTKPVHDIYDCCKAGYNPKDIINFLKYD